MQAKVASRSVNAIERPSLIGRRKHYRPLCSDAYRARRPSTARRGMAGTREAPAVRAGPSGRCALPGCLTAYRSVAQRTGVGSCHVPLATVTGVLATTHPLEKYSGRFRASLSDLEEMRDAFVSGGMSSSMN